MTTSPPPIPESHRSPTPAEPPLSFPQFARILLSTLAAIALSDLFYWDTAIGISFALGTLALAALILINRPRESVHRRTAAILILLLASAVQSAIELCFSNILVTILLLIVLMAETSYPLLEPLWRRWVQGVIAINKLPGRWFWLMGQIFSKRMEGFGFSQSAIKSTFWMIKVLFPAALALIVFTILLSAGNAIFSQWTSRMLNEIGLAIDSIQFPTIGRVFFWFVAGSLALTFIHPGPAKTSAPTTPSVPVEMSDDQVKLNFYRSISLLVVVNLVFFVANGIDTIYLWMGSGIPAGVTYTEFVHHGTYNLIATVIISALILTAIFSQHPLVTRSAWLRGLAFLWIVQDLFLVTSVLLRLRLYIREYDMTELRLYLFFFLMLVTVGFLLLSLKIAKDLTFGWLVRANLLATFLLFYTVQFLDTKTWIADYNAAVWSRADSVRSDIPYLVSLGPNAWPALRELATQKAHPDLGDAAQIALNMEVGRIRREYEARSWTGAQFRTAARLDTFSTQ